MFSTNQLQQNLNQIAQICNQLSQNEQSNVSRLTQMQQAERTAAQQLQHCAQLCQQVSQQMQQLVSSQYSNVGQQSFTAPAFGTFSGNIPTGLTTGQMSTGQMSTGQMGTGQIGTGQVAGYQQPAGTTGTSSWANRPINTSFSGGQFPGTTS